MSLTGSPVLDNCSVTENLRQNLKGWLGCARFECGAGLQLIDVVTVREDFNEKDLLVLVQNSRWQF